MVVGNGALCGHRGELAPNTERKAGLRGTSPWPLGRHSPLCWALGSLSRTPSLPPRVRRASLWGPPPGGCPSISRTVAPEGTSLASRTQVPRPMPVSWCPTGSFPGERGQSACCPASRLYPRPRGTLSPSWLPAATWVGLLHADLARPPACCLPAAHPTQARPSQQGVSCEPPGPAHAWPPSHPHLQAQPGPKYSFLPSQQVLSLNKAS